MQDNSTDALSKTLLITGGAGFIGTTLVRQLIAETDYTVVNVDCLTYAGNLESLGKVADDPRHRFEKVNIADGPALAAVFRTHSPDAVIHLAAESHVDRSIDDAGDFIATNVVGTYNLLEVARKHMETSGKKDFRFLHVSTDEVYGSLERDEYFTEDSPYRPNSPYSASKAAADHLARAWHQTHRLPVLITISSNNYGPRQYPEKLIPLCIAKALAGEALPIYGDGQNVRDWIFVEDHCRALRLVLAKGAIGETYLISGQSVRSNLDLVRVLCALLDEMQPRSDGASYADQITFVPDRPGHDRRYALDDRKLRESLIWEPRETLDKGLRKTVQWYIDNQDWVGRVQDGSYRGERLGLAI